MVRVHISILGRIALAWLALAGAVLAGPPDKPLEKPPAYRVAPVPSAIAPAALPAALLRAAPSSGQCYVIAARLTQTGPDGKTFVLSRPTLMTMENREATIDIGQQLTLPEGARVSEPIKAGIRLRTIVYRSAGKTFLDATYRVAARHETDAQGVRVATQELRVVEAIALGQKIRVPLTDGPSPLQFELVVSSLREKELNPEPSPLPPGP
jgi:hypothetical protein